MDNNVLSEINEKSAKTVLMSFPAQVTISSPLNKDEIILMGNGRGWHEEDLNDRNFDDFIVFRVVYP